MEDIFFSCGGTERTVAMLRYFKERQAVEEASVAILQRTCGKKDTGLYYCKEDKFNAILIHLMKDFLGIFNCHGGRRRRRSVEYQNAYNVVMTAVNVGDITSEKLARYLSKKLYI